MASEEPIIRDNVSDFIDGKQQHDVHEHGEPSNESESSLYFKTISSQLSENQKYSNPYQNIGSTSTNDLYEGLIFKSNKQLWMPLNNFILCIHLIFMWKRTRVTSMLSCVINMVMDVFGGREYPLAKYT